MEAPRIIRLRYRTVVVPPEPPATPRARYRKAQTRTRVLPPPLPCRTRDLLPVRVSETIDLVFANPEHEMMYHCYRDGALDDYPRDCGGVTTGSVPEDWMWLEDLGFYNPNSEIWPNSRALLFRSAGDVQRFITHFSTNVFLHDTFMSSQPIF